MATSKNYDEFLRIVELSHGRGNNHTIWTLTEFGCTAEELVGVTKHTKNKDYLNTIVTRYGHDDRAIRRIYNKAMDKRNKNQRLQHAFSGYGYRFGDLGWYFKYMPEKYKNEPFPIHTEHIKHLFEKNDNELNDVELSVYAYRYTTTLLERDNYPSKAFCSDFKQTSLYDELVSPLDWENATVSYDLSNVSFSHIGKQFKNISCYMGDFYCNYDLARDNNTNVQDVTITKGVQLKLLEQVLQLRVLCNVMMTQIYTEEQIKDGKEMITDYGQEIKAVNYFNYLIDRRRKTGTKRANYPQTARIELFSQTKSLEMLLAMGLGIKLKRDIGLRTSNKKLNKRIQTAYKTFIKAKTVDDRKSMRKLLLDQANIIINDFMGGSNTFECVMLNCADKQDEDFEKNMSNAVDIKPIKRKQSKSNSSTSSAPVKYVKANVSLSDLLNASTTKVEKARN